MAKGGWIMSDYSKQIDDLMCQFYTGYTRKQLLEYDEEDTGLDDAEVQEHLADVDRYTAKLQHLLQQVEREQYTLEKHIRNVLPEVFKDNKWHSICLHFKWNPDSTIDLGEVVEQALQDQGKEGSNA